jgi:hypothetical protein
MNYISFPLSLLAIVFVSYSLPAQAQTTDTSRKGLPPDNVFKDGTAKASLLTEDNVPLKPTVDTVSVDYAPLQTTSKASTVAQSDIDNVNPGRRTRSGSSYFGIGGNIGITGSTPVGSSSFAVFSKIGLTRNLSARPNILIEDDVEILLPLTVDFTGREEASVLVAPYVGGGLAISTGDNSNVGGLVTGGLDIPLSSQFTANAAANVTFSDDTDVGLQLGVGYNF